MLVQWSRGCLTPKCVGALLRARHRVFELRAMAKTTSSSTRPPMMVVNADWPAPPQQCLPGTGCFFVFLPLPSALFLSDSAAP